MDQDIVFKPYALSCGHLFCKSCACSAAAVLIFQGLKAASVESKCPVCREVSFFFSYAFDLKSELFLVHQIDVYLF